MHTIRLREPWQREWVDTDEGIVPLVRYQRRFHSPSGLTENPAVTLVLRTGELLAQTDPAHLSRSLLRTSATPAPTPSSQLQPTITIRSLVLNLLPLSIEESDSTATQYSQLTVRIDSVLQPYNLVEIICQIDDPGSPLGISPTGTQTSTSNDLSQRQPPPLLTAWGDVQLEIHD